MRVHHRWLALRIIAVIVIAGLATVVRLPAADAAGTTLTPTQGAWYQPDPTCSLPTGCLLPLLSKLPIPLAPPNPYPAGTLHVGFASAKETARAYLAFNYGVLGPLTSARLDIPLETSATDGSVDPATSKVWACLATGAVISVEGSYSAPPAVDCDRHAVLRYVATPQPHLTADLRPIMAGLETTPGIALVPAAKGLGPTTVWQVAFSAPDRKGHRSGSATLTVTNGAERMTGAVPPATSTTASIGGPPTAPAPASLPGEETTVGSPAVPSPTLAGPAPAAEVSTDDSFQYPLAFLFPLVLILVVPIAARALTQDLDDDEGLKELT